MSRLSASLLIFSLAALPACGGDDSTAPTPASVAGTYHATRIELTFAGSSVALNALQLGASAEIALTPQGNTTGTLIIPPVLSENGVDQDVINLAGTYTISGNTLTFQGQGDSFISDIPWTIGPGTLTTQTSYGGGTLQVTLTRS